jgi:predicted nucleic acid-binding protein
MTAIALDSNLLVYAFSPDPRSTVAQGLLRRSPVLSVQALNEFAHVARRKWQRSWEEIAIALDQIRLACARIDPVADADNVEAVRIADRYRLSLFDSLMIATAMAGGVGEFYSEDMDNSLVIDGRLRIVNPFAG